MLVNIFNILLICGVTFFAYKYFALKESVLPADERYLLLTQGVSTLIDRIEGYDVKHAQQIAELSMVMAQKLGLEEETCDAIRAAALLHDLGEIALPRDLLRHVNEFDNDQLYLMRTHPLLGELHLKASARALDEVPALIRWHHERWDGLGYPDGLKGEEIPVGARIIALADAVCSMKEERSYRNRQYGSEAEIIRELERESAQQFDPALVKLYCEFSKTPKETDD